MITLESPADVFGAAALEVTADAAGRDNLEPDRLSALLLLVARRADVLGRGLHRSPDQERQLWLRAEFEVLEQVERARPAMLAMAAA